MLTHTKTIFPLGLSLLVAAACGVQPDLNQSRAESARTRITRKVAVITLDPENPDAAGDYVSDHHGVLKGVEIEAHSQEVADTFRQLSDGQVNYEIASASFVRAFPVMDDGRFTFDSYLAHRSELGDCFHQCNLNEMSCAQGCASESCALACVEDKKTCHEQCEVLLRPHGMASYPWVMNSIVNADEESLCDRVRSGAVDEVWVWSPSEFGFYEYEQSIPEAAQKFSADTGTAPDCGRAYFVMAFNTERPGGDVLHSFSHRAEWAISRSEPGRGQDWPCKDDSEWSTFACNAFDAGDSRPVGCGNTHYPPNATFGYDYDNQTLVDSYCRGWTEAYPGSVDTGITEPVRDATWREADFVIPMAGFENDTQTRYLYWWFRNIPRGEGSHRSGGHTVHNNWWHYILCYDDDCATDLITTNCEDDQVEEGEDCDLDGEDDVTDNCLGLANADQVDSDEDGDGNLCDDDDDNDGVVDGDDPSPQNPTQCGDSDGDKCDDCSVGADGFGAGVDRLPGSDGDDADSDGQCDIGDDDDDNDGVGDESDPEPLDADLCGDSDGDTCDDCSVGSDDSGPLSDSLPKEDGADADSDGQCDAGDADDDNDGVADADDPEPLNADLCGDSDGDTCDDCSVGTDNFGPDSDSLPGNDGDDADGDGLCDAGDADDDNDGVGDGKDPEPHNADLCGDSDSDTCDDCSVGSDDMGPDSDFLPGDDGEDTDGDGLCDAGDADDDNDGVDDEADPESLDPAACGDSDNDSCDDCSLGGDGFGPNPDSAPDRDGPDQDQDGLCDAGDPTDDRDSGGGGSPPGGGPGPDEDPPRGSNGRVGAGCQAAGSNAGGGWLLLLVGLVAVCRRRSAAAR